MQEYIKIQNEIIKILNEVAPRLRLLAGNSGDTVQKGDDYRNEVTDSDKNIEDFLKTKIKEILPEYNIYGEESGGDISSDKVVTIDAIDGTSNFARRIPLYSSIVSLVEGGEPVMGAMTNPSIYFGNTSEVMTYIKGDGVYLNNVKVNASNISDPKECYALVRPGREEKALNWGLNIINDFNRGGVKKIGNFGSSAYDLSLIASGRVDIVIYGTMTTADIAGAIGFVREAGGEVYGRDGLPVKITTVRQPIIAVASKELFSNLKPLLRLEELD
jgi:fructose-1,6-bisphosphatase/inositol monophosphatase family enzyme